MTMVHRYLAEFDFRYNARTLLGFKNLMRTKKAVTGIVGKRLIKGLTKSLNKGRVKY
jgi:hypothetical protein